MFGGLIISIINRFIIESIDNNKLFNIKYMVEKSL
jgi:hypothetical protein